MKFKSFIALLSLLTFSACANHPLDCAINFVPHDDCLPGTAGYDAYQKRIQQVAAVSQLQQQDDNQTCQSFGLKFGTDGYAQCREQMLSMRVNQATGMQASQSASRQQAVAGVLAAQANQPKPQTYMMPTNNGVTCTNVPGGITCR
jgi:hypothetical protein